jgi:hypothetical protein
VGEEAPTPVGGLIVPTLALAVALPDELKYAPATAAAAITATMAARADRRPRRK